MAMKENSTRSGINLSPVYGPSDSNGDYAKRLGNPGEYPFTRGTRPYSGQGWIQRELSGEGDAKRSNEQFKYLMGLGQTGLDVIGDSPTMSLMDPDHPLARYTVGTQGVSLCRRSRWRACT
jgi:methylmalonyl-CoA mutase N-terminal domain/subunit